MSHKFPLGQLVSTPGALERVQPERMAQCLGLHGTGDWGLVDEEDWRANDEALQHGARLLSVYLVDPEQPAEWGARFWIITEADRSVTTVLLPSEY